ncbi:MAG TPA: glycosyl transferase [Flavobacterium sp.]|nr:glycosyl transferase [Flavobacterium sp.]
MNFCIITHVTHYKNQNQYFAYAPYVNEMNIWIKYADKVLLVAPYSKNQKTVLDIAYNHGAIQFHKINSFNIKSFSAIIKTSFLLPKIFIEIYKAMQQADHIHLRCPGNIGLIGCLVQILFPKKQKTAKYAGNWDPNAKQPWSYRFQKWILSNTFLTRNMKVLVYGNWENQTKNIKPFFTATYSEDEKTTINSRKIKKDSRIKFLFVGTLSKGKQPLYAIKLVEKLSKTIKNIQLEIYGEGILKNKIEQHIKQNKLEEVIIIKGNQPKEKVKEAYQNSHFLMLPSKSEGWPKVVAEAMFWGCVPVSTPVSCVSYMLDKGSRGILLTENIDQDSETIAALVHNEFEYYNVAENAKNWSRIYTIEKFETEIKNLL